MIPNVSDHIPNCPVKKDGSTAFRANRETTSPAATILALLDDPSWPTESDKAIAAYELSRARVARQATLWGGQ
jgi:hypothetical protein